MQSHQVKNFDFAGNPFVIYFYACTHPPTSSMSSAVSCHSLLLSCLMAITATAVLSAVPQLLSDLVGCHWLSPSRLMATTAVPQTCQPSTNFCQSMWPPRGAACRLLPVISTTLSSALKATVTLIAFSRSRHPYLWSGRQLQSFCCLLSAACHQRYIICGLQNGYGGCQAAYV